MANNTKGRRDFMGIALGGFTALGGIGALYAMKCSWDPLPSVKAAGFTTVDLSTAQANVLNVEKWRGKPIFVLEKTSEMKDFEGDLVIGSKRYTVVIGLCTHLGCIPAWAESSWKCACHGGEFNTSGQQTFGPPPKPFVVPPFSVNGTILTLGETGSESKAMIDARA